MSSLDHKLVSSGNELVGYLIVENLGIARGIVVRSRGAVGTIAAGIQTLFGGNITIYTELCEQSRLDAYKRMIAHAEEIGADGVIGFRYDANEITDGVTEVLAYGTAVKLKRQGSSS